MKKIVASVTAAVMAASSFCCVAFAENNNGDVRLAMAARMEREPNNSKENAESLSLLGFLDANIGSDGDVDWFHLDTQGKQDCTLVFNCYPAESPNINPTPWVVTIYNENGKRSTAESHIITEKTEFKIPKENKDTYVEVTREFSPVEDNHYFFVMFPDSKTFGEIKTASPSYVYRGRPLIPTVNVWTKDGTKLVNNVDYTVKGFNNVNVGLARAKVSGSSYYETLEGETTYQITPLSLNDKDVKVSIPYYSYTYTGKAIKPKVTVKYKGNIIPASDYTVVYKNNTKVGTATITVKAKSGNVKGSYTRNFVIKPEKNVIKTISSAKNAFKITWEKGTAGATGYQVLYSTKKDFSGNVHSYTSKDINDVKETFSKVPKSGETWYVKVRSFVEVDGTRYGDYSAVQSVKVK